MVFYFEKFGVPLTTFGPSATTPTLEESDDAAPPAPPAPSTPARRRMAARPGAEDKKKKDPRIPNRMAWQEFYPQHQADFDALNNLVTERAMQGIWAVSLPAVDEAEDDEEEKED